MSDHNREDGTEGARSDQSPFTPEQLAWLKHYRVPMPVVGAVAPAPQRKTDQRQALLQPPRLLVNAILYQLYTF